jgi:AMP deaminase
MGSTSAATYESHHVQQQPLPSAWTRPLPSHPEMDTKPQPHGLHQASAQPVSLTRETSFPNDDFRDLHVSGSEPKIFPGVVSRNQRRDSLAKERSGFSENEQTILLSKGTYGGSGRLGVHDTADEDQLERTDADMEEAGGIDE